MSYLRRHPLARDTARWIAQFWAETSLEAAEDALAFLLARGFLRASQCNGEVLYSRNPSFDRRAVPALLRDSCREG